MDEIFKWFTLQEEPQTVVRIFWFAKKYEPKDFEGVNRMLVAFLHYCAKLDLVASRKYLQAFLQVDGKSAVKKHKVRVDTLEGFNYDEPAAFEEAYKIIVSVTLQTYDMYCQVDLEDRAFKVDMSSFMTKEKSEAVRRLMANNFPKLSSGDDVDDVMDELQYRIGVVRDKYDIDYIDELDYYSGQTSTKESGSFEFLFKTGIPCIDGDIGGMFTRMLWSFTGQPGAGKTRLITAHFVYRCAVVGKFDVLFDELELTKMEIDNMLIAHHIVYLYGGKIKIPDSVMNKGEMTSEQKAIYEAAKIDLFESGKYGRITVREKELVIEDMYKEVISYRKYNKNFKLWVVDYVGLVESKPKDKYAKHLEEFERIAIAYKTGKKLAKRANIGVLFVNQFNEKGVEAAEAGKTIHAGHVQGGQIIQRHSDFDWVMTMTEEEELAGIRSMSTVKKRSAKGFRNRPFSTDLAVSIFKQIKEGIR